MLVGKTRSVRTRIALILFATFAITALGIALAFVGSVAGFWEWPPKPSSRLGVGLGFLAGAIVLFEMLILPRKWLRGRRLGAVRIWMWLHVWLGLVCLPVVLVHAGLGFGGPLPTVTLTLFLLVTLSGIWGLVMQQWLPEKLLSHIPDETVTSQIDFVGEYHAAEAVRIVEALIIAPPESESAEPLVVGPPAGELLAFRDELLLPYLRSGNQSRSPLTSQAESAQRFFRLRGTVPEAAGSAVDRLRELADLRRQWDSQAQMHFWLHNWLMFHLPLSVAMTGLMLLHAVRALKYW